MVGLRWSFRYGCWMPNASEWTLLMSAVQSEERERISRFAFQHHAKAALVGRLLIRKAVHCITSLPYSDIEIRRTEKGKPYLANSVPQAVQFDFNISHDGDYAVLAAETSHNVGVDTVQLDRLPGSKSVTDFFSTMHRQLTPSEWMNVEKETGEAAQLAAFYRYWSLKESYVKMIGIGVGFTLSRLSFNVNSPLSRRQPPVVTDTTVLVDGRPDLSTWYEESLLDDKHLVVVALQHQTECPLAFIRPLGYRGKFRTDRCKAVAQNMHGDKSTEHNAGITKPNCSTLTDRTAVEAPLKFTELTLNDLLKDIKPLSSDWLQSSEPDDCWHKFNSKPVKPSSV